MPLKNNKTADCLLFVCVFYEKLRVQSSAEEEMEASQSGMESMEVDTVSSAHDTNTVLVNDADSNGGFCQICLSYPSNVSVFVILIAMVDWLLYLLADDSTLAG